MTKSIKKILFLICLVFSMLIIFEITVLADDDPVTMIESDLTEIDFGSIGKGFTKEESDEVVQTVTITNTGITTIKIKLVTPAGSGPFSNYWYNTAEEIMPGDYMELRLRLNEASTYATAAGLYTGIYRITATNVEDSTDKVVVTLNATVNVLEKYVVSLDANNEEEESYSFDQSIPGTKITLEDPSSYQFKTPEGKQFGGWIDGEDLYQVGDTYTIPEENRTLIAKWNTIIDTINITGVELPEIDAIATTNAYINTTGLTTSLAEWQTLDGTSFSGNAFLPGTNFNLYIGFSVDDGYVLSELVTIEVNEEPVECEHSIIDNYVLLTYSVPKRKYTVSFNTNGGTSVNSQIITDGEKATKPGNPSKDNLRFYDWYLEDLETKFNFNTPITRNTTLYAKWYAGIEMHTLEYTTTQENVGGTFNINGNVGTFGNYGIIEGETVNLSATPSTGYLFLGWFSGLYRKFIYKQRYKLFI